MAGRESHLPLPPGSDFLHYLDQCVDATEECVRTFRDSLMRLEPGIRDLPRLTKILSNQHSFLLLPAPAIDAHKNALCESLGPQVDQLISRSDALVTAQTEHMKRLEERVAILQSAQSSGSAATARLNLAGTESLAGSNSVDERSGEKDGDIGGEDGGSYLDDLDLKEVNMQQRRRIAMLKGKRKKLEEERASLMSSQA